MRRYMNIVENNGERFLFHGSKQAFDQFDVDKIQNGMLGWGVYLSSDLDMAEDYARPGGVVYRVRIPQDSRFLDIAYSMSHQRADIIERLKSADLFPENDKMSAGHFYSALAKQLGSPRGASELLASVGITGIAEGAGSWGGRVRNLRS